MRRPYDLRPYVLRPSTLRLAWQSGTPVPMLAAYRPASGEWVIQFNQVLAEGTDSGLSWRIVNSNDVFSGEAFGGAGVDWAPGAVWWPFIPSMTVVVTMDPVAIGSDPGSDRVYYLGSSDGLRSVSGTLIAPFDDIPYAFYL